MMPDIPDTPDTNNTNDTNDTNEALQRLAERLGETEKKPVSQIKSIIELCGLEFAEFMMENTILIEEAGGMLTADGKRRRTPGGVFFYLVRHSIPLDIRPKIFPPPKWYLEAEAKIKARHEPSPYPAFEWENRVEQIKSIIDEKEKGKVDEVNIQLKGRPGYIEHRADLYVVTLEQQVPDHETFPRGMPTPPNETTRYVLFVGEDQWKKHIGKKLEKNKELIIAAEGACHYDESLGAMVVFTRSVKVQQAKKPKPQQKEQPKKQPSKAAATPAETKAEDTLESNISSLSPEIAKKLRPLYGARKLFQKRLADIEALPPEKQSGLQAAKLMLERTEQQIAELEKQGKGE